MKSPSRVQVVGALAQYAGGFTAELARLGYTPSSAVAQLQLMAWVSRWLAGRGLEASALTAAVVAEFFAERRTAKYVDHVSVRALAPLMGYLRQLGVVPVDAQPSTLSALEVLLERYRAYLTGERGLRPATAGRYVGLVRPFLVGRVRAGGDLDLAGVTAGDVNAFVVSQCRPPRRGSVKSMVTALRSVLRFLHVEGVIARPLFAGVPSVAGWKLAGLPRGLQSRQVRALLGAAGPDPAVWIRDLAMLTMLVRLGLRVGEVASLTLDDIDWRRGEIVVCGKGDRRERLPLPADVGQAVATYLRDGRPVGDCGRRVFVTAKAPRRGLTPGAVTQVVVRAARRAGLGWVTGHRLRHTAASAMLRGGASLDDVGQVLRHRDALTTTIYAKVDIDALRVVARAWPSAA
jgi:integrase/recombinase XerD